MHSSTPQSSTLPEHAAYYLRRPGTVCVPEKYKSHKKRACGSFEVAAYITPNKYMKVSVCAAHLN